MKKVAITLAIVLLTLFVISPAYAEETTPETIQRPTPIPSDAPKESYFWGWFLEKGWEEVKLGTVPATHKILKESMPRPPKGYVWGWDEAQMRYVWLKVKDGKLVIRRIKFKDRLGNWYWKELAISSPFPVERQD